MITVIRPRPEGETMDRLIKRLSAVALAATVTLLSACDDGGNDAAAADRDTADGPARVLSESDFIDQVNGICIEHNEAIGGIIGPLFASAEPTPDAMQEALDGVVALSRQLAVDIDALAEPAELSDEVTTILDALNEGTDEAASHTGPEFFATEDDPWAEAAALGNEIGLTACSGGAG
jgi:hypothetical protein